MTRSANLKPDVVNTNAGWRIRLMTESGEIFWNHRQFASEQEAKDALREFIIETEPEKLTRQ